MFLGCLVRTIRLLPKIDEDFSGGKVIRPRQLSSLETCQSVLNTNTMDKNYFDFANIEDSQHHSLNMSLFVLF